MFQRLVCRGIQRLFCREVYSLFCCTVQRLLCRMVQRLFDKKYSDLLWIAIPLWRQQAYSSMISRKSMHGD